MIHLIEGLIASSLHVLSGPDHLAAVTPIAIESRSKSWSIGLFWGLGHTAGVLLIGVLFMLFREVIPVEKISEYSEQIVGIVLVAIGVWALLKLKNGIKKHHHNNSQKRNIVAALSVGILHGFAGVSHLIGVIPTLSLPETIDSVMYLAGFGIGTIFTMMVFSWILGTVAQNLSVKKKTKLFKYFRIFGGSVAIIIGILWFCGVFTNPVH
ncbi:sulfite exporter TauE/SafE family protein [Bacteroidota bacterium]